jgi:hypothetical protein
MTLLSIANSARARSLFAAGLAVLTIAGCSSKAPSAGAPGKRTQVSEKKKSSPATTAVAAASAPASAFTVDPKLRDPFYPKAKRAAESDAAQPAAPAIDVLALLREGFQGTIGSGEHRIALINNVMLEPGRQTEILLGAAGTTRSVTVRCREVSRDVVVLEVQGHPNPVRIAKASYN